MGFNSGFKRLKTTQLGMSPSWRSWVALVLAVSFSRPKNKYRKTSRFVILLVTSRWWIQPCNSWQVSNLARQPGDKSAPLSKGFRKNSSSALFPSTTTSYRSNTSRHDTTISSLGGAQLFITGPECSSQRVQNAHHMAKSVKIWGLPKRTNKDSRLLEWHCRNTNKSWYVFITARTKRTSHG